jgi:superfamily I DNA/RNA helicase
MPKKGNLYLLLWVDHHDKAYDWAKRHQTVVHPTTGTLQVYEVRMGEPVDNSQLAESDTEAADASQRSDAVVRGNSSSVTASANSEHRRRATDDVATTIEPLFNLDESRLLGIGVPPAMTTRVAQLSDLQSLQSLQSELPTEAFEALYLFAEGCDWQEIWTEYGVEASSAIDVEDIETAVARDASRRVFHVVDSDEAFEAMLAAPLERWRVYLHPSQRRLVERDWNGPVRVLGGAGTGKTVVAMHRAVWLARQLINQSKILFLTYNTNLAADIKANLAKLASSEELACIEVINIDAWVARYLKSKRYTARLVVESELEGDWENIFNAAASPPGKSLPLSFYKEEWERVVLPNRIDTREAYLKVSRTGRGVALSRRQRAVIWDVFDDMRTLLRQRGSRTYQDGTLDARDLVLQDSDNSMYGHVIVDETQDMGSEALMLIRALVDENVNDLFFVGDGHQRIYRRRAVMGKCGIKIVGRSRKLKINYRTTEEIRKFASALLQGLHIDDLDGGEDGSKDYLSLTRGPVPELTGFNSQQEEIEWIVKKTKVLSDKDGSLAGCCVLLRNGKLRNEYAQGLRNAGLDVVILESRADNQSVPGIRVANMHRVKGLEFRHVFMAAMNKGVVPNYYSVSGSEDPVEIREKELSERALVHVCASRAIESLMTTWHGVPSEYIVSD